MQIEFAPLQRTVGITFVFVTHDQEEALTLSDRIAVMSKGRVLQIDAPEALYENPNCREVAEFIGTMNFIEGKVAGEEGDGLVIDVGEGGTLRVQKGSASPARGTLVYLAIRPEKLELGPEPAPKNVNRLEGTVVASTYFGDRSHFLVRIAGRDRPFAIAMQNSRRSQQSVHAESGRVWISWPLEAGILLTS